MICILDPSNTHLTSEEKRKVHAAKQHVLKLTKCIPQKIITATKCLHKSTLAI